MLVITRKRGEKVQIGPDIEVMVTRVADGQVRLAIKAPATTKIVRNELVYHVSSKEKELCSDSESSKQSSSVASR